MAVAYSQNFNAADGTALVALTPQVGSGALITDQTDGVVYQNKGVPGVAGSRHRVGESDLPAYYGIRCFFDDKAGIATSHNLSLHIRRNSDNNEYRASFDLLTGDVVLERYYGAGTNLGSVNVPGLVGAGEKVLEFFARNESGQKLYVRFNGTTIIGPVSDTNYTGNVNRTAGWTQNASTTPTNSTGAHIDLLEIDDSDFYSAGGGTVKHPYMSSLSRRA